jgi:phosphatidyl-myo-inositol alpha-mannosyltransferase
MSGLKIALVSPFDFAVPSGVNQHVQYLSAELRNRGHRVTIFGPLSRPGGDEPTEEFHSVGHVVRVPANGSMAHITASLNLRHLRKLIETEQYDIVHCHEPLTPTLAWAMLRYSNTVNIGTFHAYGEKSPHYRLARPILRPFFNRIHGRIAVSELAGEFVSRYFGGDFEVIPNGVDVSLFDHQAEPVQDLMDGRPNLLFLGRFEEERKGFRYALKALQQVARCVPDVRLVVVGRGDASRYERKIRQYGLERNVQFAGAVSDDDRVRYMTSCRFLIAPNTGGESQGLVVLEAMAAGLPVVATSIAAYRRAITSGAEGTLVPPEDHHALAQAMLWTLSNPGPAQDMAAAGRIKAAEFNWPHIAERVEAFYLETAERYAGDTRAGTRRMPTRL